MISKHGDLEFFITVTGNFHKVKQVHSFPLIEEKLNVINHDMNSLIVINNLKSLLLKLYLTKTTHTHSPVSLALILAGLPKVFLANIMAKNVYTNIINE